MTYVNETLESSWIIKLCQQVKFALSLSLSAGKLKVCPNNLDTNPDKCQGGDGREKNLQKLFVSVYKNTKIFGGICIYIKKMANKSP